MSGRGKPNRDLTDAGRKVAEPALLYRYDIEVRYAVGGDDYVLVLREFPVIRRTPRGVWIASRVANRFVLHGRGKRFAYPTEAEALTSLLRRKERQVLILEERLDRARDELSVARRYAEEAQHEPA